MSLNGSPSVETIYAVFCAMRLLLGIGTEVGLLGDLEGDNAVGDEDA